MWRNTEFPRINVLVSLGVGALVFQAGYHPRKRTFKTHRKHVFFRYENRPLIRVFACVFLNLSIMSFPKFVNMTKNTPFFFSNFARFCTPKRCTRVHCLVLKNNPNYVIFFYEDEIQLQIQVAPRIVPTELWCFSSRSRFTTCMPMKGGISVMGDCQCSYAGISGIIPKRNRVTLYAPVRLVIKIKKNAQTTLPSCGLWNLLLLM